MKQLYWYRIWVAPSRTWNLTFILNVSDVSCNMLGLEVDRFKNGQLTEYGLHLGLWSKSVRLSVAHNQWSIEARDAMDKERQDKEARRATTKLQGN
mgnify:CR=1 FL=1